MAARSRGRGTAAAFGFVLLIAGLIGAGVLYVLSLQRPDAAVEGFARAAAGCTTSLDFSETGTFFVYAETAAADLAVPEGGCDPAPTPGERFAFEITGPEPVTPVTDVTVVYDSGDFAGASVARFEIDAAGLYEIEVRSEDAATVAAVGRDPGAGVADLQRNALLVGAAGGLFGLLLLLLAGLRSKRAATPVVPDGPGWGPRPAPDPVSEWPPSAPEIARRPINPHQPDVPAAVIPPPPPLPARAPGAAVPMSPWGAPTAAQPVSSQVPVPPPAVPTPRPIPVLPDTPGAVSGQWPPSPPSSSPAPPPPPPPPSPRR